MASNTPVQCLPGFDCVASLSCPAPYMDCPPGHLCSVWSGRSVTDPLLQDDVMGPKIARITFGNFEAVDDLVDDWRNTLPASRFFSGQCPVGYYCPNTSTILPCPEGKWCAEATVYPHDCDAPSSCSKRGLAYQVTFSAAIVAGVLTLLLLTAACYLRQTQKRREAESRKRQSAVGGAGGHGNGGGAPAAPEPGPGPATPALKGPSGSTFLVSNVNLSVHGRPLLRHITLPPIKPGELTVFLGPSGAGKTLLLNVVRGTAARMHGAALSGTLTIDSTVLDLSSHHTAARLSSLLPPGVLGFVPKADVVDRAATVREALAFSARARLPSTVSNATVSAIVDSTLSTLQLTGVADVVVGGSADAPPNISGGQLKRVNIGMELVAQPRVLLLDEPTAGLDASVALDLLAALKTLAVSRGITVVAVLHQPRAEAFTQFNTIALLAQGQVAYAGAPGGAVPYFTSLEVPIPVKHTSGHSEQDGGQMAEAAAGAGTAPSTATATVGRYLYQSASSKAVNPADWIVDVTAGLVQPIPAAAVAAATAAVAAGSKGGKVGGSEEGTAPSSSPSIPSARGHALLVDLGALWRDSQVAAGQVVEVSSPSEPSPTEVARLNAEAEEEAEEAPAQAASLGLQVWVQARRGLVTRLRDHGSLALFTILHMFMAIALSSGFTVYLQGSYRTTVRPPLIPAMASYCPSIIRKLCENNAGDLGLQQLLFFMAFAVGSTSAQASIGLFAMGGNGPALIRRECGDSGLSTLAFAAGRMGADLAIIGWNTSLFTAVWMFMGHAGRWYYWLAIITATGFAASGMGYVASLLTRPVNAAVVVMVGTVTQSVFSGVEPRLTLVNPLPIVNWAWYLSYAPYVAEASYATWVEHMVSGDGGLTPVQQGADYFGYDVTHGVGRPIGALFGLGLAWRAVAMLILWRTARPHATLVGTLRAWLGGQGAATSRAK